MPGGPDVSSNIKELYAVNKAKKRPRNQIVAIAESQARKASGGPGTFVPLRTGKGMTK